MRTTIVMLLVCGVAACSSSASTTPPVESTYVGAVASTDVAVGMVSDGSHVALFFCGGPTSVTTSTKWLRFAGSAPSFQISLNGWTVVGSFDGSTASGTVDRGDGKPLSWSATRAPAGSVVGLYGFADSSGTSGVVVQSTDPANVTGAFIETKTASIQQIVPIMPLERTNAGLHVTVSARDLFVPSAHAQ